MYCFITAAMAYMGFFNLLNFPAGIVPITKVTEDDLRKDMQTFPTKDMYHRAMKRASRILSLVFPVNNALIN